MGKIQMSEKINIIEPFGLFGSESLIESKDQAAKIAQTNSYYILLSGLVFLAGMLFNMSSYIDGLDGNQFLMLGIAYLILGIVIKLFKSRLAATLSLVLYALIYGYIYFYKGFAGVSLLYFIFVAAAYRSVVSCFYYHKKQNLWDELLFLN